MAKLRGVSAFVLLLATTASAMAQLALRPAKPVVASGQTTVAFRVLGSTTDDCTITPGFFPTDSNPKTALCFWNQKDQEYLKYGQLLSSSKSASITTEIVSDAFGGIRVALSTAVAAPTRHDDATLAPDEPTSEQDRALNLLASNGGNVAVTGSYPIYYRPLGENSGAFVWNSYFRAAANMQALGGETQTTQKFSDLTGNIELAVADLHVDLLGYEKNINLLGYSKVSAIVGTDKFAKSLSDKANKSFVNGQIGAGLRVGEVLMIYAGYNWFSDKKIPGRGATLSIVIGK